jgi:hypothetical protein
MPIVATLLRAISSLTGAVMVAGVLFAPLATAFAADKLLDVDWANPEIAKFVQEQQASPRRSLGPVADDKLSKVKLPVVGFETTPGVVENTFRLGPKPAAERDVVVDEDNPVWYQIVEHYGDMTVSIEADLRVQHVLPDTYPVYDGARPGAAPQAGPDISVFDEENEGAMEGLMAEYTVVKFGVPYTVKIECSSEARAQCRDTAQIAKDSNQLKILRANPPQ